MTERWVRVCSLEATVRRPILPVTVGGQQLIIVRDGEHLHAVERACPHEQADLLEGRCSEGRLHCPRHAAAFDLRDGQASPGWSIRRLRRFPTAIVDGDVLVDAGQDTAG